MQQKTQNTFNKGLQMDLNPLTTPRDVLTDCVNGTIITYNGNEFVLQNDMGNCKVDTARLTPGFIPLGMKEYGGIVYVVSYNPITQEAEYGSFPSPQRDFSTTDFANLQPVEFKNTDFILENGITTEKTTSLVGKLFEPELFQLAPGDQYAIVYDINEPVGGDPTSPTDLDTEQKYENYISKDPNNRKLFSLRFFKIDNNNNLVQLDSTKMNVIPDKQALDNSDYAYFTENSKSALAVGLEIEQLDMFDANVVDRSLRTDTNKKVGIEAIGSGNSLATFQGVKVDVTSPVTETFYLERNTTSSKVSAVLDGLAANDDFECSLTPYSPYCLYPKLKKDFKLTLGQYLTSGSGVNDLFRYYVDTGYVQVDFDYKFEGNSVDGIHLYVEFYDPWSDYSIVKTVDNPTYYGINNVILELVDEPAIDQFDSTTVGGTSPTKLISNRDTEYEKTLLNSTNMIRTDQVLRRNHFYIVRVSGVDKTYDAASGTFTYQHYDFYKGLYTTTMFNDTYNAQAGLSSTDAGYIGDFNSLDFDLSTIKYNSNITLSNSTDLTPVVTTQRDDLTTNNAYYKISTTVLDTTTPYKYTKTFENKKSYNVSMSLAGADSVFGTFKENLLSITTPSIQASNGSDPTAAKPTIVDSGYDLNNNISPNSIATWQLNTIAAKTYNLTTDVTTSRSVFSPVSTVDKQSSIYKSVSLLPSLYYMPNNDGPCNFTNGFYNGKATVMIRKYDCWVRKTDGTLYDLHSDDGIQDLDVSNSIGNAGLSRTYSAMIMTSDEQTWTYGGTTDYNNCRDGVPVVAWKRCNMLIRTSAGNYKLTKTIDPDAIVQFFSSLYVISNVNGTVHVYYPDSNNAVANGQIATTVTFPDINFQTNFTPNQVNGSYVNTYLSTFRFKAMNEVTDFQAATLNSYIASRQGSSSILDGKNTLRDGFIPYINQVQTSTDIVSTPAVTINQAADNSILNKYISGQTQYTSDPLLQNGQYPHGHVYTDKPDYYGSYVANLQAKAVYPDTQIDPNAVYVEYNDQPSWPGIFAKSGSCSGSTGSPSLIPTIAINKQ